MFDIPTVKVRIRICMLDQQFIKLVKDGLLAVAQTGTYQLAQIKNLSGSQVKFGQQKKLIEVDGIVVPYNYGISQLMTEPKTFLRQNIEAFWYLFSCATEDIESPLCNFALRPILELGFSRVIYFSTLSSDAQRENAIEFWLCTNALLVETHELGDGGLNRREAYQAGIDLLTDEKKQKLYQQIMASNFPHQAIHKKLHELAEPLLNPKTAEKVSEISKDLLGECGSFKWEITKIYRSLSMYEHGNPVLLRNLPKESVDKTHITRCAKALLVVGEIMIAFTDKYFGTDTQGHEVLSARIKELSEALLHEWKVRIADKSSG